MSRRFSRGALLALVCMFATAAPAWAAEAPSAGPGGPQWALTMTAWPTNFKPGEEHDAYVVTATNTGGAPTEGETSFSIDLPPGVTFSTATLTAEMASAGSCVATGQEVTCSSSTVRRPGELFIAWIEVNVDPAASGILRGEASVSGGGAALAATARSENPVEIAQAPAGIAPESFFSAVSSNQAGAHPNATAGFTLSTIRRQEAGGPEFIEPAGSLKSVLVETPPGLIGSTAAAATCTFTQFNSASCPNGSQVGVDSLIINILGGGYNPGGRPLFNGAVLPVYKLTPPAGVAAEFGFKILSISIIISAKVRSGGDYGLSLEVGPNSNAAAIFASTTTFFGTPALYNGGGETAAKPMIYNPTSCGAPQPSKLQLGFYQTPALASAVSAPMSWVGCEAVPFGPELTIKPTTSAADSPTGLQVDLHVPQSSNPKDLASADLEDATVELPTGTAINAAAANALAACTTTQIELNGPLPATCPEAAKVGTVEIDSPLVDHPIPGGVYVARQRENPFGSLLAIYIAAHDPQTGLVVKLAGHVAADPSTGRLTATFADNPQLPFEDLKVNFFDGPGAVLKSPPSCGDFTYTSQLTPWTGTGTLTPGGSFKIDRGPTGGACPSGAFNPQLSAGTTNPAAGQFSPFVLHLTREDGTQQLSTITAVLPKGLLAKLAGIPYCSDAALAGIPSAEGTGAGQLISPSCPAASQVGTVNVGAGVGSSPFYLDAGRVYLAGPYKGAPLSLAIVTPAVAGPFDLGNVLVRAALKVDPETTQITAVSDPLPTILQGIPLDLRSVTVSIDRSGFTLNPTSCEASAITTSVGGSDGATASPSNAFQATGCSKLQFRPGLKLSLKGSTQHAGHPALKAVLTYPQQGAYANIARAQVNLPHSEFLDQSNLNKTCTKPVLLEGRCPTDSIYGKAKAWTPLLEKPLEGPVYLVGGYGYKLPALVADLNGQIRVVLKGKVDSGPNRGIRNTFEAVPDAPVSRFVLELKGGKKYSLLENSEDLCQKPQRAIAHFTAQSGAVEQAKPLIANECGKKKRKQGKKTAK